MWVRVPPLYHFKAYSAESESKRAETQMQDRVRFEMAIKQIGSHYAASVHDIAYEYRSTLRQAHNVLTRITAQFECEKGNNWRALKHLRAYNPKATGFQLDIL